MLTQTTITSAARNMSRDRRGHQPLGSDLSAAMETIGGRMSFLANEEIYIDEEATDYRYKVISGTVRTYKILYDGRRQIGAFYHLGDVFGLETGDEHVFSAEAVADAEVLVVKRSAIFALAE